MRWLDRSVTHWSSIPYFTSLKDNMCIILLWNHNLNYYTNISFPKEDSLKVNFDRILVLLSQVKIYLGIFKKTQLISMRIHLHRPIIRRKFNFAFWSAITNSILLLSEYIIWWFFECIFEIFGESCWHQRFS